MQFTDLPDHCLLLIFNYCELNTMTTLTAVCSKLKQLICTHIFHKNKTFGWAAKNPKNIAQCLVSVARLVRTLNPSNFHIKIYRNLQACKEMPLISVDTETSSTEVFVESHFLTSLPCLNNICDRIKAITIYLSIYDCHNNDDVDLMNLASWTKLKKLCINGYDKILRHSIIFPTNIWDLDIMSFGCMFIAARFLNDAVRAGQNLKNVTFHNCTFDYMHPGDIISVAETVRDRGGHFPLGLTFMNVQVNCEGFLEAMLTDDVQTYIYIEVEPSFMVGSPLNI